MGDKARGTANGKRSLAGVGSEMVVAGICAQSESHISHVHVHVT
jgi:hypothetical protein